MDAQLSVVIAPDSFKGSLGAAEAAAAIARGWALVRPNDRVTLLPQADGGEGTLAAMAAAVTGAVRHEVGDVTGPDHRPTPGAWLELPGQVGVVELAQCCGLPLMAAPDPLGATTRGLGEVIRHAMGAGMTSLVVGLGGSASTDGGAGVLAALGLELLDARGAPLADGGGALTGLHRVERTRLLPPPPGGVVLLADVTAPLLGPTGAVRAFGPQKGATPGDLRVLEAGLTRLSSIVGGDPTMPGSGAAGGTGFGLVAAWGATLESGARRIQRLTGLHDALDWADVVLTGEGRFDATSLTGKVVGELLLAARGRVPVGVIAGQVAEGMGGAAAKTWVRSLTELAGSTDAAMADPVRHLVEAGRAAARHLG